MVNPLIIVYTNKWLYKKHTFLKAFILNIVKHSVLPSVASDSTLSAYPKFHLNVLPINSSSPQIYRQLLIHLSKRKTINIVVYC